MEKTYLYKIYTSAGTFLTTWTDVVSDLNIKYEINAGLSVLKIRLARPETGYGENEDVKQGNRLKIYCFDKESGVNGILVYSGILSSYTPTVIGSEEFIDITFFSQYWDLANKILTTTVVQTVDLMEYANDTAAQAAYVTNDSYGSDVCTAGTATADSTFGAGNAASEAFDNVVDLSNYWLTSNSAWPHWLKYDFGAGVTKKITRLRIVPESGRLKNFIFEGSNNDSTWTQLYSGQHANDGNWETYSFDDPTAYRYYKITASSPSYEGLNYCGIQEVEMIEGGNLQSYSEGTIKSEGSYALKGVAKITNSLNKTLTKTVSPTIDLSNKDYIGIYMRASRTGANIKIGFHDSGGTTTEVTPTINVADTWELKTLDLSAVSNANKDVIDSIIITIVNADADNTFYLDNITGELAGNTEVPYLSYDPSNILKDLLDKYTALAGSVLDYATGTVDLTGTTVSYTYNTTTYQEALKKVIELCPDGWYFRIGADDLVYLKAKEVTPTHKFTIGRDILSYVPEKRFDNIVNTIYFRGGDTGGGVYLYKKYTNSGSITAYGERATTIVDQRVTVAGTAQIMSDRILDEKNNPEIRIVLKVLDSNDKNEFGYNIESIKVGETCKILNATSKSYNLWDETLWDVDSWDYEITNLAGSQLQIMSIDYYPDYAILELSNKQPDIAKRIEDIDRNWSSNILVDNPTAPS